MSNARQRRPIIGLALLLVMVATLAACGAGQVAQTGRQNTSANGADGDVGPIAVRNASFPYPEGSDEYPAGSSVMLSLTIVNSAGTADRLDSVTSPLAGDVEIDGATTVHAQRSLIAVGRVITEAQDEATETGEATVPTSELTSPFPTPEPAGDELAITLVDLGQDLRPGMTVSVVLLFEQAGELELRVPIGTP